MIYKRRQVISIEKMAALTRAGKSFVLATIVKSVGSSPRKTGAKIIVFPDQSTEDSIGGGALEKQVIEDAISFLKLKTCGVRTYDLTRELGMCCGGKVEVYFEVFQKQDPLYLFGAGHIAQPLASFATEVGFKVTVIDERNDYLNEVRFPHVDQRLVTPPEDAISQLTFDAAVSIAVCTHDHVLDQRIVEKCIQKPFRYLGLIGSHTKAAKTRARLKAFGISNSQIERLRSPMGIHLGAETPHEIAISIVSELIAFRHKAEIDAGWEKKLKKDTATTMMGRHG